jgi:hypothetical protein
MLADGSIAAVRAVAIGLHLDDPIWSVPLAAVSQWTESWLVLWCPIWLRRQPQSDNPPGVLMID